MEFNKKERVTPLFFYVYINYLYMAKYKKLVRQVSSDNGVTWQTIPDVIKYEKIQNN